jgi:multicomponent Na+:H+ antiporter subunit D
MQFEFLIPLGMGTIMPLLVLMLFALVTAVISALVLMSKKSVPKGLPDAISIIGFSISLVYIYNLGVQIWENGIQTFIWTSEGTAYGGPLGVVLAADMFSVLMMGLFSFMGLVVAIYSAGYMREETGLTQYYILLLIMVGAMDGVVIAGDLFTLFIFYEIMSLCSFILVAFHRNWEGIEAAIKYLMMSAIGSTLVLFSASYLYGLTGTLNLGAMSQAIQNSPETPLLPIIIALLTAGFAVKGAVVPFSAWLADAHPAAPSGISAMLSGVVIKIGIYGILRTNTILFPMNTIYFNWPFLISVFAIITMTAGNFWALTQTDLKRLLAYSTITQIGFILFAFGTATEFGYQTGTFYIINHALSKGLLFLCAGAFIHAAGTRNLEDLKGIGKKMPITGAFFVLGLLSLMGMPPLAGFYAKFLILAAGVEVGWSAQSYYMFFTIIAIVNVLISLGYYLRMLDIVWLNPISDKIEHVHHSNILMIIGMGILGICLLFIGIYPTPIYSVAEAAGSALYNFHNIVNEIATAGIP